MYAAAPTTRTTAPATAADTSENDAVGNAEIAESRGQHFDRDVAIELRVARAIHLTHAAGTRDDLETRIIAPLLMSLVSGSSLGSCEITSTPGAGGMGEVYRARRLAQSLAALNHPSIATLFGMEESDGRHFLVMELVEGETLAEKIARHRHSAPAAVAPSESASRGEDPRNTDYRQSALA